MRWRSATTGVTTKWWKEERGERIFVDFNQNSPRPHHRLGVLTAAAAGRAGLHPGHLGGAGRADRPAGVQPVLRPGPDEPTATRGPAIDDVAHSIEPLLKLYEESGEGEANYPPDYPKMPGEPPRVQPSKKVASHWNEQGERIED